MSLSMRRSSGGGRLRSQGEGGKLPPEVDDVEGARPEAGYRPGSVADFDRLYRSAYPRLKRTLTAILGDPEAAEDCVQDAFVSAFEAWPRWTPQAPAEVWLHRIALNSAFSFRRKRKLREVGELIRRLGRPDQGLDPTALADIDDLLGALRRLPPKMAAAIVLRYYHGYTNRDIAAALSVSERMIGLRLAEAKRRLSADLGPDWSPGSAAATIAAAVAISPSGLPTSGAVKLSISGSPHTDV